MYGPEILYIFDFWIPFSLEATAESWAQMAAGETVFRDTLISVIPAGVRVTSPT